MGDTKELVYDSAFHGYLLAILEFSEQGRERPELKDELLKSSSWKKLYEEIQKRVEERILSESKCTECEAELKSTDKFCPECGRKINNKENCKNEMLKSVMKRFLKIVLFVSIAEVK